MKILKKFNGVVKIFSIYWTTYGRTKELLQSLYFWMAIIITGLSFNIWFNPDWWSLVLGVIPNLMGFSLGGFAIFLAFGDNQFLSIIRGSNENGKSSPFINLSASFVHFILVQMLALLSAIAAKSLYIPFPEWILNIFTSLGISETFIWGFASILRTIGWFLGFFLFIYALFTAIAATMAIFRLTRWFDIYSGKNISKRKNPKRKIRGNHQEYIRKRRIR
ncbi:MAG: hypothetical protein HF314_12085 [Ignavibacteria bacterium]|jgi:hypothetical protein|nr:hypothetical protein [Ignavibacteria bacterium]MCU7503810.1 hypothetical protein [Ignavibacteria bacterium]MCU7517176.1 hypothetical protein [Ignavibacteria bacterium]